jgi:hypothetical protein
MLKKISCKKMKKISLTFNGKGLVALSACGKIETETKSKEVLLKFKEIGDFVVAEEKTVMEK